MKPRCRASFYKWGRSSILVVAFEPVAAIEARRRLGECRTIARSRVAKAGGVGFIDHEDVLAFGFSRYTRGSGKAIRALARGLERRAEAVLRAPLAPKVVDDILGIFPRERLRRYKKDGRLPTCGRGRIAMGAQIAQYPLFPIVEIARIAATEGLIDRWRQANIASAAGHLFATADGTLKTEIPE